MRRRSAVTGSINSLDRLRDTGEVDPRRAHRGGSLHEGPTARLTRQANPDEFVEGLAQSDRAHPPQLLDGGGHVVVQAHGRTHAATLVS